MNYDHLIIAGTNSELRECGALVPAVHWGAGEPDTKNIKKTAWEYTENDVRKVMQVQRIIGRVLEWLNKLNPEHKPTILFAPATCAGTAVMTRVESKVNVPPGI